MYHHDVLMDRSPNRVQKLVSAELRIEEANVSPIPPRRRSRAATQLSRQLRREASAIHRALEEAKMNRIVDGLLRDLEEDPRQ
jgi:hypothetical protein